MDSDEESATMEGVLAMDDNFAIEAFTLLALAVVIIVLRTIARWNTAGPKNFQLDDYVMPIAAVVYGLETGAAYCVGTWWHGLANNAMTDQQRAALDPDSREYHLRVGGSKTQVIGWSLYTLLLWLLKTCMSVFYSRLTAGLPNMQLRVRIGYVLVGATYVATICAILFGCHPMLRNWQIYPNPGNHCQPAVSKINVYVTVVLNVSTDVYLISIPAPMLFKARLPWREKLELLILFSGGLFVMMAGILRCILIVTNSPNGASQAGSWACRETFVAVVIGNIPMIYPIIRRRVRSACKCLRIHPTPKDAVANHNDKNHPHPHPHPNTHPVPPPPPRRRKFHHPLSIPDSQWTFSEWNISDEDLIGLPSARQPPPTCTAETPGEYWEAEGRAQGIRVVTETIIQSAEKGEAA